MKRTIISMMALAVIAVSCKKEESNKSGKVDVNFKHMVGDQVLEFDQKKYTTTEGHQYEVRKLQYFVSNLYFQKSDGSKIEVENPIYVDADNANFTSRTNIIELEEGIYTSIGLTFGIDSTENVSGSLTSIEETEMVWVEGIIERGYHYMKYEGTYDSLGNELFNNPFNLHTGGTMGGDYSFEVVFDNSGFTIDEEGINVEIVMDLEEWLKDPNAYDFATYGPAIMMNMMAQKELMANGQSVLSVSIK